MLQNVGLAFFPWMNGKLRVVTGDYTASMLMFALIGVLGVILSLLLLREDRRSNGILERGAAPLS
jgi:cyanate permease